MLGRLVKEGKVIQGKGGNQWCTVKRGTSVGNWSLTSQEVKNGEIRERSKTHPFQFLSLESEREEVNTHQHLRVIDWGRRSKGYVQSTDNICYKDVE